MKLQKNDYIKFTFRSTKWATITDICWVPEGKTIVLRGFGYRGINNLHKGDTGKLVIEGLSGKIRCSVVDAVDNFSGRRNFSLLLHVERNLNELETWWKELQHAVNRRTI